MTQNILGHHFLVISNNFVSNKIVSNYKNTMYFSLIEQV